MAMRSVLHQKNTFVPKVGQLLTVHYQADKDLTLLPIRDFFGQRTKVPEITVGNHIADLWEENFTHFAKRIETDIDTARNEVWITFEWRSRGGVVLGTLIGNTLVLDAGEGLFDRRVDIRTILHTIDVFTINADDPTGNPDGFAEQAGEVVENVTGFLKLGFFGTLVVVLIIAIVLIRSGALERIAKAFIGKG